jgi:8-oxo-dGTP pyrophosphatase MutT (NUDIX family)
MSRGEVPEDAAQREVREEVGLDLELGPPTVVIDPTPRRVDVVFAAIPSPGQDLSNVSPRSPEIVDVGWFDPEDMPRLQPETVDALAALSRAEGTSPPSTPWRSPTRSVDEVAG